MWTRTFFSAAAGMCVALLSSAAHAGDLRPDIVGGDATSDAPNVVGLTLENGVVFCTGTLVSPRVVLTAAHCISDGVARVYFGSNPKREGVFVHVGALEAHPAYDAANHVADVALVQLARAVTVPPARLAPSPMPAWPDTTPVRFYGFGDTSGAALDTGQKRVRSAIAVEATSTLLRYGVATCHGDSGGPAFATIDSVDTLVGVTSYGDAACIDYGVSQRVDAYRAWIDLRVAALDPPSCALDSRCVPNCAHADPDCDATAREQTLDGPARPSSGCAASPHAISHGTIALAVLTALLVGVRRRSRRRAILALACASCGGPDSNAQGAPRAMCEARWIGDANASAIVEVLVSGPDGALGVPTTATSDRVTAVGFRARNVDGCAVTMTAELTDLATGETSPIGGTIVELTERDGWGWPDPSSSTKLVPVALAPQRSYEARIAIDDGNGRSATIRLPLGHRETVSGQ